MARPAPATIAYLDMPSGISGDMFLGCLVDLGWSMDALRATVQQLGLPSDSWSLERRDVQRGALAATLVHVASKQETTHRHLSDIRAIFSASQLAEPVKACAARVFARLAQAEAEVHGTSVDEVHFHEVGAVDAIVDIVGVCAGLQALGIEQLFAGAAPLGPGFTKSAHGRIPLPAPATLSLLASVGAPVVPAPGPGELVTPTGAALVAELATFGQPAMVLQKIGYGAGQKEFEWPNVARLWLGQASLPDASEHKMVQIETNIDDMNPELYGAVRAQLFAAGALDVWTTPIQMKKERPGILLSVLCAPELESTLAILVLEETTTLGVRVHQVHRHEAQRRIETIDTPHGAVRIKLRRVQGAWVGAKPEYDDCVALAAQQGLSVRAVYEAASVAAQHYLTGVNGE